MKPKEFIQNVLIDEMKDIVFRHAYLSFALISVGIEFIGKCALTECDHWDIKPEEKFKPFDKGVELMTNVDKRYADLNLKDQLRNGFAHTLLPKSKILLSEIHHGAKHFEKYEDKTVLVIEILYRDFVIACHEILKSKFDENDKMNKEFLTIK